MTFQQALELRRRASNMRIGLVATVSFSGYIGYIIGANPPNGWEWLGVIFGSAGAIFVFGGGALVNAWTRGVYEATWAPSSERVRSELNRIERHMQEERTKRGVE